MIVINISYKLFFFNWEHTRTTRYQINEPVYICEWISMCDHQIKYTNTHAAQFSDKTYTYI